MKFLDRESKWLTRVCSNMKDVQPQQMEGLARDTETFQEHTRLPNSPLKRTNSDWASSKPKETYWRLKTICLGHSLRQLCRRHQTSNFLWISMSPRWCHNSKVWLSDRSKRELWVASMQAILKLTLDENETTKSKRLRKTKSNSTIKRKWESLLTKT